ncbi:MAG: glycerol-3-phosphate 1-O-acyltransferase PlsY [Bacteroidales bacterium]
MSTPLAFAFGYLCGSIPFAFLLPRHTRGVDLRRAGSGNLGAANVMRTAGPALAFMVLALDAAKGGAAVLLANRLAPPLFAPAVAGVAAVLGHAYPVWMRFRGGKGVATMFGVFVVLAPAAAALCVGVFLVTLWSTKYVSLGSVMSAAALSPVAYLWRAPAHVVIAAAAVAVIVVERHRANIARLQAGTERRFGQRV